MQRVLHILICLDSLALSILTLGKAWPGETISSAAYRSEIQGGWFGKTRPLIDWLFSPFEDRHCFKSWFYAISKANLPEDMR
jgi:hypothetical protein